LANILILENYNYLRVIYSDRYDYPDIIFQNRRCNACKLNSNAFRNELTSLLKNDLTQTCYITILTKSDFCWFYSNSNFQIWNPGM